MATTIFHMSNGEKLSSPLGSVGVGKIKKALLDDKDLVFIDFDGAIVMVKHIVWIEEKK
jgi:hypothetical protein